MTSPRRPAARRRPQSLARVAASLCRLPAFWAYLDVENEAAAAVRVRELCGVASRAELDTNAAAAQVFHARGRRPFALSRES